MNNNNGYFVYLHTINKTISGYQHKKYYVGITNDIDRRWANNGENYKRQIFYNAIQKYGWENIRHKILFKNLSKDDAMKKEKEMIIKYNSKLGKDGYNVSDGGENICEIRTTARNIYCIELGVIFRSSKEASEYTKENKNTIFNKCKNYELKLYNVKKGYKYCFSENVYKYFNTKTQYNSTIIVDILTGIFIPNRSITNKKNTRLSKRSILDCNRYLELSSKGMLNNKKRYMFLKDYLYLFKMAKIGNIME